MKEVQGRKHRIIGHEASKWVFWVCLIVSIALIIAGFLTPPMAVIDGSVLTAVGELFAFAALGAGWDAIMSGYKTQIKHGNTTISVGDDEDIPDEEREELVDELD